MRRVQLGPDAASRKNWVEVDYDGAAGVWRVGSSSVPGLEAEAGTGEELLAELVERWAVPPALVEEMSVALALMGQRAVGYRFAW